MKEEAYIDQLFEAVRNESAQVPYEKVAQNFTIASTIGGIGFLKNFFQNYFNLNTLAMISIGSAICISIGVFLNPTQEAEIIHTNISPPSEAITTPSLSSTIIDDQTINIAYHSSPSDEVTNIESISNTPIIIQEKNKEFTQAEEAHNKPQEKNTPPISKLPKRELPPLPPAIQFTNTNEDFNPIESITKSEQRISYRKGQEIVFKIYNTDPPSKKAEVVGKMKVYNIQAKMNLKYYPKETTIKTLDLHLKYRKSLDWDMKVTGFDIVEIKLVLDEKDKPYSLSYRLNDQKEFSTPNLLIKNNQNNVQIRSTESRERSDDSH